jgi:multiple sugar transport system substrate-binding protein
MYPARGIFAVEPSDLPHHYRETPVETAYPVHLSRFSVAAWFAYNADDGLQIPYKEVRVMATESSNDRRMSRRQMLRAAVGGGLAALLAACGAPASPTGQTGQQPAEPTQGGTQAQAPSTATATEIRLTAWGDVTDKQVYEQIVAAYNKVDPNTKISIEQYPGGYYEKIQANFAANTSADIIYFQGFSWQPFADKDLLLPLDDYIKQDSMMVAWPDIPNYKDNTQWHGQTFMSAADTGSVVMFYAKELFEKAGAPPPTDDWSYTDFQSAIEKTTREEAGVTYYGYSQAGGWNGTYLRSLHWMRKDGQLEWDTIVEPKEARWLQPEIIDGLQFTVVDAIAKGWCPSPATIDGGGVTIGTGRVAMTMEGPWFLANMQGPGASKEGGVPFDVVVPPKGAAGKNETIAEVHGHVIAKASKNPDAAWKVLKFILGDEGQQIIAQGGRMCGTPDNIEKFWVPIAEKTYSFTNGKAFADAMRTGRNPIIAGAGANYDAVAGPSTPLQVAWDAMLAGTSAKEALEAAQPALQKILDDYWAKK